MKSVLITGATDGIGLETAKALLSKGFNVIVHGRNAERVEAARNKIFAELGESPNLQTVTGDLSSFESVAELALQIKENFDSIDVLLNNAGVFSHRLILTEDGFELTFQVNHLSHFLLSLLLLEKIPHGTGRIINVSSMAHSSVPIDFAFVKGETPYNPYDAYAYSKLGNILFTFRLARELKEKGITVNALHPGVIATKLLAAGWGAAFGGSVMKGAETSVFLASSDDVQNVTGQYFVDKRISTPTQVAFDENLQEQLWEFSLQAVEKFLNR